MSRALTAALAQATVQCTLDGYIDNILKSDDQFDQCVDDRIG
ncbi:hypothetical protein [Nocardioides sp.]|nr:hypothetical protein [Nocardioides sp.]